MDDTIDDSRRQAANIQAYLRNLGIESPSPRYTEALVYIATYVQGASKLAFAEAGAEWFGEMNVSVTEAIEWAGQGYLPHEAAHHIRNGVSPARAKEMEETEAAVLAGPDGHLLHEAAERRLQELGVTLITDAVVVDHEDGTTDVLYERPDSQE